MIGGQVVNFDEAIAGKLRNSVSCETLQVRDGDQEMMDCDAGSPPSAKNAVRGKDGRRYVSARFGSLRFLANTQHGEIRYSPALKAVNLRPVEKAHGSSVGSPFSHGFHARSGRTYLETRTSDPTKFTMIPEGPRIIDGWTAINIGIQWTSQRDTVLSTYSLDPEHGYLPRRVITRVNGKVYARHEITRFRECSKSRWFPDEIVYVTHQNESAPYPATIFRVTELEVDRPPQPSDFTIDVPAGTQVCGCEPSDGVYYLKQDEKINISDLKNMFQMLAESKANRRLDTDITAMRARWWHWHRGGRWFALGAAVLLLGVASRISQRRVRGVRS
jgi:hypothetical protein